MLEKTFSVSHTHRVLFTRAAFRPENPALRYLLAGAREDGQITRCLAFVDSAVDETQPGLIQALENYAEAHSDVFSWAGPAVVLTGGEVCKNDFSMVEQCWQVMHDAMLDRHSFVIVIGGGAVLDLVCFAASTAHRGIRHVRFPTTTLSQGDGGVGVKNGVNFFGKKNWVGSFAVPYAVVNDFAFLDTLTVREKRCGIIEALKVALIRDAKFFHWIEDHAEALAALESDVLEETVRRSAELHVEHIATGGDPFELGSARPLDFGHWAAHKLEQLSEYRIRHGEAVAVGIALDTIYARRMGFLDAKDCERVLTLLEQLGFELFANELLLADGTGNLVILNGLEEFREHLGGQLTITLLKGIGQGFEVHDMVLPKVLASIYELQARHQQREQRIVPLAGHQERR